MSTTQALVYSCSENSRFSRKHLQWSHFWAKSLQLYSKTTHHRFSCTFSSRFQSSYSLIEHQQTVAYATKKNREIKFNACSGYRQCTRFLHDATFNIGLSINKWAFLFRLEFLIEMMSFVTNNWSVNIIIFF